MLIGIHPALPPDILHTLASMGHGDTLAIVDANFPSVSVAQETTLGAPHNWTVDSVKAVEIVLSLFPIDTFTPEIAPVMGMQVVGEPATIPDVVQAAAPHFAKSNNSVSLVERMAFYDLAKTAFAVVRTIEMRPYGNFLIRKGVILA